MQRRAEPNPLLRSASFAAAITLSGTGFGHPAVAGAEPGEWDIGAHDECLKQPPVEPNESAQTPYGLLLHHRRRAAGFHIIGGGLPDSTQTKCVAPAGNARGPQQSPPTIRPPRPGQATVIPSTQPDAP
jgi:hypothetical protein